MAFVPDQAALAALAVVLEQHYSPFSAEFLDQLASSQLAELSGATRVAQAVSTRRSSMAVDRTKIVHQTKNVQFYMNYALIYDIKIEGAIDASGVVGTSSTTPAPATTVRRGAHSMELVGL